MFIPIRTDYRMKSRPWVNYALVAANVILYFAGVNGQSPKIDPLLLHPAMPHLYQFFSCIFLHANLAHLLGNMVFLWVFGNAINDRFGHLGYLAYYLAGGLIAAVGYVLLGGDAPVLGASGAISAVAGAYLVLLPRARVTLLVLWIWVITTIEVSSLYFLLFQFIWNLLLTLGTLGAGPAVGGGVAYTAHSSGYVFGIAVAAALLAFRVLPRDTFDLLNLIRSGRRRGRYRRMVSRGFDPFGAGAAKPTSPRRVRAREVASQTSDSPAAVELRLRRHVADACRRHDLQTAAENYLRLVQIADDVVLSLQNQLDVANYLMSSKRHPAAADAYQRFLKHYSNYQHLPDIYLMLGLLYGRYLHQYDQAERMLNQAIEGLTDEEKLAMAKADLAAVRQKLHR